MSTPIKIIVFADNAQAKTIADAVGRAGFSVKGKACNNLEKLQPLLNEQVWDTVFASHTLPGGIDLQTLCHTVNHKGLRTPIIVIAPQAGDRERIDALSAGAQDAVSSDQHELLGLIIRREMTDTINSDLTPATTDTTIVDPETLSAEEQQWFDRIRQALDQNRFVTVFQPIVNLNAEPSPNYELLMRMLDADNKEIAPGIFLSSAEKAGLTRDIDRWVIGQAIHKLEHSTDPRTRFFVKLSSHSVRDTSLTAWIGQQLHQHAIATDRLVFEITEADALAHEQNSRQLISGLKKMNCLVALDHVGLAGNTEEFWLSLDPNYIKLAGQLIKGISENKQDKNTLTRITGYAKSRKIITIAQFVQDAASLALLWQLGINYIQGYYLQKPDAKMNYDFEPEDEDQRAF